MDPKRAARRLATLGTLLLLLAFLLRGLSLGLTIDAARAAFAPPPAQPALTAAGHYTRSADGKQILFEQQTGPGEDPAWFSIPPEGGLPAPATAPVESDKPFRVRNGQILRWTGDGSSLASGSPPGATVGVYTRAPDGKRIAFGAFRPGGSRWGLYILDDGGRLAWLGDFPYLGGLDWSPDGLRLAFVAPADGVEQIFTIDRGGQNLRQVTGEPGRKLEPRWSPDGRQIAYLVTVDPDPGGPGNAGLSAATPTAEALFPPTPSPYLSTGPGPSTVEVALVNADGSDPRLVNRNPGLEYDLMWLNTAQGQHLAYVERVPWQPQAAYLYALDPQTSQRRRLYPPLALDSLQCPASLPAGGAGEARSSVSNSSLAALDAPLLMRSGPRAFAVTGPRDTGRLCAQSLPIPPGQSLTTTWPLQAAPGLATHVSLLVNLGSPAPLAEQHCLILNTTYFGLPNIAFLPFMPPLTVIGMLLCLPWLRHRRSFWLWAAWLAAPLLSLLLIAAECVWIYQAR